MKSRILFLSSLATGVLVAGCASSRTASRQKAPVTTASVEIAHPDAEPEVRDMAMRAVSELKAVHFPYDSDQLSEEARATLKSNAEWLKLHATVNIQVAGHCDQRGTVAYNLALGQRRAASVREYYLQLGVKGSRVATISYGKERALCAEATESCWSDNRRGETLEVSGPKNVAPAARQDKEGA